MCENRNAGRVRALNCNQKLIAPRVPMKAAHAGKPRLERCILLHAVCLGSKGNDACGEGFFRLFALSVVTLTVFSPVRYGLGVFLHPLA